MIERIYPHQDYPQKKKWGGGGWGMNLAVYLSSESRKMFFSSKCAKKKNENPVGAPTEK